MPVYLELFHGRKSPEEEMDDWGEEGPVLGPFTYVHTTYANDIKLGTGQDQDGVLVVQSGLVYYDGMYYGDWSVFGEELVTTSKEMKSRVQKFCVRKG